MREEAGESANEANYRNEKLEKFQKTFNSRHPFGIRLWKPALYEKHRSIEGNTYYDLHSYPIGELGWKDIFRPVNIIWTVLFGVWIGIAYTVVAVTLFLPICLLAAFAAQGMEMRKVDHNNRIYRIIQELCFFGKCAKRIIDAGIYFMYPFGRLVKISEYGGIRNYSGNEEGVPLLREDREIEISQNNQNNEEGRNSLEGGLSEYDQNKIFIYVYRIIYVTFLAWLNILAALCCMLLVFFIPMTQLNIKIVKNLFKSPFSVKFSKSGNTTETVILPFSDRNEIMTQPRSMDKENMIDTALCVKCAAGRLYYKHTIKGINVIFVNLMFVVAYSLIDYYGVSYIRGNHFSSDIILFMTSLVSIVPLAYIIGMAVASVTSETGSLALGAVINATFGSIIEIILYILAIINQEQKLVEGAIIGTLLASLLALPGLSMMFGAIRVSEQKFNSRLAGITCTTLMGAIVAAFLPTLSQSIYGSYSILCSQIPGEYPHVPPENINLIQSRLYKQQGCTIIRESLHQDTFYTENNVKLVHASSVVLILTYIVGLYFTLATPDSLYANNKPKRKIPNENSSPKKLNPESTSSSLNIKPPQGSSNPHNTENNFNRDNIKTHIKKSLIKNLILLFGCTTIYSFIAEIIVKKISSGVIDSINISPKMMGLTLFAIVPMITEFYNAISFAMNKNIALGLEIGSAYLTQALMIQIPVLILFSYFFYNPLVTFNDITPPNMGFTMIFSTWDIYVCLFACWVFLRIYVEGKSNFFKGTVLFLTYSIIIISYLLIPAS